MNKEHGTMPRFPAIVMDNFYDNPDAVREFALNLEYEQSNGVYAGKRTKDLSLIDDEFYQFCTKRLISLFWDLHHFKVENAAIGTQFTLTPAFADTPEDFRNRSWIHVDSDTDSQCITAAVVYLNPNSESVQGTTLYDVKPEYANVDIAKESQTGIRQMLFQTNKIDNPSVAREYEQRITEHNSMFKESVVVANKYNRIIAYDSNTWHGATNFHSTEPRLTQTFFIYSLEDLKVKYPIERVNAVTL